MGLDPIEYDADELRELSRWHGDRYLAAGFLWEEPHEELLDLEEPDVEPDGRQPGDWGGSLEERQKPYLTSLPDGPAAGSLARRWIERLAEAGGFEGAVDALSYYESLGWLTERAERDLQDFLLAAGSPHGPGMEALDEDDHIRSLNTIVALSLLGGDTDGDDTGRADGGTTGSE